MHYFARIILVDRDPLFRTGVGQALKRGGACEIVAEGASHADAVQLCKAFSPDVVVIGGDLRDVGIDAVRRIAAEHAGVKTIVLTDSEGPAQRHSALQAGASACHSKAISGPMLLRLIISAMRGEKGTVPDLPLPNQAAAILLPFDRLTKREREVLERVSLGLTNKEVARELKLSEKTIKQYMSVVMDKLQVRNRVEAVVLAKQLKPPE